MPQTIQTKLHRILEIALATDDADMGNIQLFRPVEKDLVIVAHKGFKEDFLEYFRIVKPFDSSACGRAFGIGSPVMINDTENDCSFTTHRKIARSAGFRAVKSIPVVSEKQQYLGVISIHFREPKCLWDTKRLSIIMPDLTKTLEAYGKSICTYCTLASVLLSTNKEVMA